VSETDVARQFLTSEEYRVSHADVGAFLVGLYAEVLRRSPDDAGLLVWQSAAAQGASRDQLAQGFLTSLEANKDMLDAYYTAYLGRSMDPLGEAAWLGLLNSPQGSGAAVSEGILASDEYWARAGASTR